MQCMSSNNNSPAGERGTIKTSRRMRSWVVMWETSVKKQLADLKAWERRERGKEE